VKTQKVLQAGGIALRNAAQAGIFTTMYLMVGCTPVMYEVKEQKTTIKRKSDSKKNQPQKNVKKARSQVVLMTYGRNSSISMLSSLHWTRAINIFILAKEFACIRK
jgi:Sterol methyltransferase C-terminal